MSDVPQQVFATYQRAASTPTAPAFCPHCGRAWEHCGSEPSRCAHCQRRTFRNPYPAVSVLVIDGEKFLLCRRRVGAFQGGRWCLPCGYIGYEEDFLTAARREVLEETGLGVTVTGILSVVSNFFQPDLHSLVVVMVAEPTLVTTKPVAGDDIDLAQWFDDPFSLPEMAFEADIHIIQRRFETLISGAPVEPHRMPNQVGPREGDFAQEIDGGRHLEESRPLSDPTGAA